MTTVVLDVPDISCEHCAHTITNALTPVKGVTGIQVDIPAKRVRVEFDESLTNVRQLSETLDEADYPVASVVS